MTTIIPLKLPSAQHLAQLPLDPQQPVTLMELQPGTLIPRVTVEHTLRNGLAVRWGPFRGAMELPHLGAYWLADPKNPNHSDGWKTFFQQDCTSFPARILAVDPVQKIIRLTRLPHLMRLQAPSPDHLPPTGTVVEQCTVVRLDPGVGALLALPSSISQSADRNDNHNNKNDNDNIEYSQPDAVQGKNWFKPLSKDPAYIQASRVKAVYVHISKALDPSSSKRHGGGDGGGVSDSDFAKQFAVGSQKHTVRILSTDNWMEGVASGATAPSIVHAHVLTHADLVPGRVYKQVPVTAVASGSGSGSSSNSITNHSLSNSSVLVDFGLGIRGLIPTVHLFDQTSKSGNITGNEFRQQMRKVKYGIGAKVDVRVLTVDASTKKCLLTAKKTLVKAPDNEIITSYDAIQLGQIAVGYVSKVDRDGLSVTFFNNVFGRITARSLVTELGLESPEENYSLGDVVRCRVIDLKKKKRDHHNNNRDSSKSRRWKSWQNDDDELEEIEHDAMDAENDDKNMHNINETSDPRPHFFYQLMLSLRLDGELMDTSLADHAPRTKIKLNAGAILPLKSLRVKELVHGKTKGGANSSHFVPGYAIVGIKSKYMVGEAEAATMPPFIECKLPYDQLLDHYDDDTLQSPKALDELAESMLTVGRKINRKGLVLYDPKKSNAEYSSGIGTLAILSVRPKLVETADAQKQNQEQHASDDNAVILPCPATHLYAGQKVLGYVAQKDERHGAFIRFLDGMTGLVPKRGGGLLLPLYGTALVKVVTVDDTVRPRRILLGLISAEAADNSIKKEKNASEAAPLRVGDMIEKAQVQEFDFHRAYLKVLDEKLSENRSIRVRIHCSMSRSRAISSDGQLSTGSTEQIITSCHPFDGWTSGKTTLANLKVVSLTRKHNTWIVEVTNRMGKDEGLGRVFIAAADELTPGDHVSGIVSAVSSSNSGLWLEISPTVSARVPALELSQDVNVLNNLAKHFPVGSRLNCVVLDNALWQKRRVAYIERRRSDHHILSTPSDETKSSSGTPILSVLAFTDNSKTEASKPCAGDLVVGRIDRSLPCVNAPDLMLNFRGGYIGRCCITELKELDDWTNFPLGRTRHLNSSDDVSSVAKHDEFMGLERKSNADRKQPEEIVPESKGPFAHGMFVQCRVLDDISFKPLVEVSLRPSRIEGDCDDDKPPETGEMVHAYVVDTSKKGCFLRLNRTTEGRVILKELCDGFLPDPATSFPMGRLVVGKVKSIHPSNRQSKGFKLAVDLDMRESTLVEHAEEKLKYESIKIGDKYAGTVTRIEDYGVFVRIENSQVCGLVHKSECSDRYINNLANLYDPGDLVKLIVVKKNDVSKQLGFSMKASHFDGDDDSSAMSDDSSLESRDIDSGDFGLDSDNENFASQLAMKVNDILDGKERDGHERDDDDDVSSTSKKEMQVDSGGDDTSGCSIKSGNDYVDKSQNEIYGQKQKKMLDTNVGFNWSGEMAAGRKPVLDVSEEESDLSDAVDSNDGPQKAHKSRKKQTQRRREEDDISRRETALADGTADENPETAADFERLIAGSPNSSELWIKYMAFHLTLANIPAAREVANRAFSRIEFRQEKEKLNVWCALLTLELKYGSETSLSETLSQACQHNNPKYVYLRMCEMMEKQGSSSDAVKKADEMFCKMCKKFKDKKKVWIAHMEYMLRNGRYEEAFALSKRALLSLKPHKHMETMSKFAQLVFEFGSADKARTIFDGLLRKCPKRLDLFFVYVDKEVKHGDIDMARSLFAKVASPIDETLTLKLSDRQMKRFFKKWFCFEVANGTEETQERVKDAARAFVERSASGQLPRLQV